MAIQAVNNSGTYTGTNVNTTSQAAPTASSEKASTTNTSVDTLGNKAGKNGQASEQMMKEAVGEANNKLKLNNRHCQFTYEKDINRVSVKLIDEETGEVIREIPSEETLDMIRRLKEMTGLLVDEQR